jgi:hypothetical protein
MTAAAVPSQAAAPVPGDGAPEVQPLFSRRAAALMVLIGVFAFSALVVLLSYAPDLRSSDNGQPHALSRSAIGYAGLVELLKLDGQPVVISRAHLTPDHRLGVLVATPGPDTAKKAVQALGFGGPVLVIAPKWFAGLDPFHKGWVAKAEIIDTKEFSPPALMAQGVQRRAGQSQPVLYGRSGAFQGAVLALGPIERFQTFAPPDWVPLLVDDKGAPVLSRDPKTSIYLLSDPDIVNTHGLKDVRNAIAADRIVRGLKAGDGPVIFDVTLNGLARERSVLRLLFDPPFLAVTLCVFAAACLAGYQAACRFGAVRRAGRVFALGKEALADNTAALIRLARREHRMGARYADLTRAVAAKAVAAPRELSGDALTQFLDRMGRQRGATDNLTELTALAAAAPDRERLASVAQRLFRWRLEMTRERQ